MDGTPPVVVSVPFDGERAASGPLTLGQRNTLKWVGREDDQFSAVMHWMFTLPPGATLHDIKATFAILLARHEALRTRYLPGDEPTQQVLRTGTLPVEVHPMRRAGRPDLEIAELMIADLRAAGIDFTSGVPLRVAVAVENDVPEVVVAVYSHMAIDYGSMALIGRQFTTMVADPATRVIGEPTHQPLDQATVERSTRGEKAAEAALRYWDTHLRTAPQSLYPVPRPETPVAAMRMALMESPAAGIALGHVSARTKSSRQVVLLAAVCAVLAWRTGMPRCVFASVSGNRFRLRLREYVGSLAQDGLLALDVAAPTFDSLVTRAAKATLAANTNSMFDATKLWRIIDEIGHERGTAFTRDFTLNDVSSHLPFPDEPTTQAAADQAATLLPKTTITWSDSAHFPVILLCNPAKLGPDLMLALTADLAYVSEQETEMLLRGIEKLLVAAATTDVDLNQLTEITAITPVVREADWIHTNTSWIKLSEVRRLLADALRTPSHIAATETGLTAYLTATDEITTPAEAHAACMARLVEPGRHTAMAPAHYVLCHGTPQNPTNTAAWRALPVTAEGNGRIKQST